MTASIARYLKDFSAPPPPAIAEDFPAFDDPFDLEPQPIEVPLDIEAERAEAHAAGRSEALAEADARWSEERAKLVASHEHLLAELKSKHQSELAEAVMVRFQQIAELTAQAVGDQTARILAPLIDEALAAKAVSDMADLLKAAILEGDVGVMTVRGPVNLFEKLKEAMGTQGEALRHVEAPDLDISVDIADTALVTRMSAWLASLRKVMG